MIMCNLFCDLLSGDCTFREVQSLGGVQCYKYNVNISSFVSPILAVNGVLMCFNVSLTKVLRKNYCVYQWCNRILGEV